MHQDPIATRREQLLDLQSGSSQQKLSILCGLFCYRSPDKHIRLYSVHVLTVLQYCRMQVLRVLGLLVCLAAAARADCSNYVENCNAETGRMVRIACTKGEEACTCQGASFDQTINTQVCETF